MTKYLISKSILQGKVKVSGAKNSALRLLAASILTDEEVILKNYPSDILDAKVHVEMLEVLGKKCKLLDQETLIIEAEEVSLESTLKWEGRSIRNTLLILGALTARTGRGAVPLPGGCKLGDRSFDLHEMILSKLGARVWQEGNMLLAEAPKGGLVGADIYLPIRSTGATENAIISGCLSKGVTKIRNPHIRPEILDLIGFLRSMGVEIQVYGQERIDVIGSEGISGTKYSVMPDNMEAITWLIASVITGGDIEILDFPYKDLEIPLIHLRESGVKFYNNDNSIIVRGGLCFPIEISTGPYPGINSDVQPILAAFAACAHGESRIIDLRFPGRYGYAKELQKMGMEYSIDGNLLKIQGNGGRLEGAEVTALDLRAGASMVLCGLVANGDTVIDQTWQIERGYNNFKEKLMGLNGKVKVLD